MYFFNKSLSAISRFEYTTRLALLFMLFLSVLSSLGAQNPPSFIRGSSGSSSTGSWQYDTTYNLASVYIQNIFDTIPKKDTTLHTSLLKFDPARSEGNEHITTGNLFDPAYPLIFAPNMSTGFISGYSEYNVYKTPQEHASLLIASKPYTNLYFSQLSNRQNLFAAADFARSFKNNLKVSLQFRRAFQQGIFSNQSQKATLLHTGISYTSKDKKHITILSFSGNAFDKKHNGGILNTGDLNIQPRRAAISTWLSDARSRNQERHYTLNHYRLIAKGESQSLYARASLTYHSGYDQFADKTSAADTVFYGQFLIDTRGLRRRFEFRHGQGSAYLYYLRRTSMAWSTGLIYDFFAVNTSPDTLQRNDLTLHSTASFKWSKFLKANASAKAGIAQNAGNFLLQANVEAKTGSWLSFHAGIRFFRSEPTFAQKILNINEQSVLNTSWEKPFGTILDFSLNIPKTKTTLKITQNLVNNLIYWEKTTNTIAITDIKPVQYDSIFSHNLLSLHQNFNWYKIRVDNSVYLQLTNRNLIHLPKWYTSHKIYWQGNLFTSALELAAGIDITLIPSYNAVGYSPLHGQFFNDTAPSNNIFPDTDIFIMGKVSRFRSFFMIENAGRWLTNYDNLNISGYPQFDPLLRFGIQWTFLN